MTPDFANITLPQAYDLGAKQERERIFHVLCGVGVLSGWSETDLRRLLNPKQ